MPWLNLNSLEEILNKVSFFKMLTSPENLLQLYLSHSLLSLIVNLRVSFVWIKNALALIIESLTSNSALIKELIFSVSFLILRALAYLEINFLLSSVKELTSNS